MDSTYVLGTSRDIILTTRNVTKTPAGPNKSYYSQNYQTLSDCSGLFRLKAKEIILTQIPGTVWPLSSAIMDNPLLNNSDYIIQVSIPNCLAPTEIGDGSKDNLFFAFDLREMYEGTTNATWTSFKPTLYRFYAPAPTARFWSQREHYTTFQVQIANTLNQDHPILKYAYIDIKCEVQSLAYATQNNLL
jgi:hypothetical protein